jgi:hypothetical protein
MMIIIIITIIIIISIININNNINNISIIIIITIIIIMFIMFIIISIFMFVFISKLCDQNAAITWYIMVHGASGRGLLCIPVNKPEVAPSPPRWCSFMGLMLEHARNHYYIYCIYISIYIYMCVCVSVYTVNPSVVG